MPCHVFGILAAAAADRSHRLGHSSSRFGHVPILTATRTRFCAERSASRRRAGLKSPRNRRATPGGLAQIPADPAPGLTPRLLLEATAVAPKAGETGSGMPGEMMPGDPVIPTKYFAPDSSGLTYEVKRGVNRADFELKD